MKIANRIAYFLLVLVAGFFLFLLISLNLIPDKYLWVAFAVTISLLAIIGTIDFVYKKKLVHIIMLIITVIGIGLVSYLDYYLYRTNYFINNLESELKEEVSYYVLVNSKSSYQDLTELNNKSFGTYSFNSNNYDQAYQLLTEKIKITTEDYNDVNELIDDLLNDNKDALFMSANNYEILKEEITDLEENTKILYEIKVELLKDTSTLDGDNENLLEKPFNVFISGIDTSGSINLVSRSDVNIVMTINPQNNEVVLTSIPRDYYVQLHETTGLKDKLTHAGIYGIDMSVATVEDLLGIEIDYYVRVNFTTIVKVIDAIGGIDVYSDQAFSEFGYSFKKGMNHLNGQQALMFARIRHVFEEGDRKRGEHQQAVIEAVIKKLSSSKTLLLNYGNLLDSLSNTFQTNISTETIQAFVKKQLDEMPTWQIKTINLDGTGANRNTYSMPSRLLYVLLPDEDSVAYAKQYIEGVIASKTVEELDSLLNTETDLTEQEE